ncbi:hypothetical protein [Nocardioides marmoraquaticus]
MNRTPASLLPLVTRAGLGAAVVLAVVPAALGSQGVEVPSGVPDPLGGAAAAIGRGLGDEPAVVASGVPGIAQRATTLMIEHDCWAGEAPDDVDLPGHVVVTVERGDRMVTRYGGARLTGRALDHVFGDPDPRIFVIHGFCR